ncbi:FliM/FliN family flagellar motor switch protein [Gynuella sunshinyii]|uniref:Flagellar motor switch/type III secretory pathway protein n=1 Tax=Gynuella sunshinyii YC6258 TaxID=1445510 RepID=A0A0C5VHB1_9GAMM|nr:FliM/FliN family flagellar motor switch protein [Gynuella sunshinyii]AJQ92708.1 flagellar motor switch/type III secretory pathway protein [Gynuella sunshinyii YC6258]
MSHTLFWLTDEHRQHIVQALSERLQQLASTWSIHDTSIHISRVENFPRTAVEQTDYLGDKRISHHISGDQKVMVSVERGSLLGFLRLPMPQSAESRTLVDQVIQDLLTDLYQKVFGCEGFTTVAAHDFSGLSNNNHQAHILIECQLNDLHWTFLIDRFYLAALLFEAKKPVIRGGLQAIAPCLNQEQVEIAVSAGSVRLRLSELGALQPGTVLTANTRIQHPLNIQIHGETIAKGFIGKCRQQKALVIART